MAENLYQLGKGLNLFPGQKVIIGGPHDYYGVVIKKQASGYYLIRGLGNSAGERGKTYIKL